MKHHRAETATLEEKEMGWDKTECRVADSSRGQESFGHVSYTAGEQEMAPHSLASHHS